MTEEDKYCQTLKEERAAVAEKIRVDIRKMYPVDQDDIDFLIAESDIRHGLAQDILDDMLDDMVERTSDDAQSWGMEEALPEDLRITVRLAAINFLESGKTLEDKRLSLFDELQILKLAEMQSVRLCMEELVEISITQSSVYLGYDMEEYLEMNGVAQHLDRIKSLETWMNELDLAFAE